MKSIAARIRQWEKAKRGNLWDLIKGNVEELTSFTLVGTGWLIINVWGEQDSTEGSVVLALVWVVVPSRRKQRRLR